MFGFGNFEGKCEEKKIKRKNRKKEKVIKKKSFFKFISLIFPII